MISRLQPWFWSLAAAGCALAAPAAQVIPDPLAWPDATRESRPWSYWWWLGSAVDPTNLTRELTRYRDAGWGGVHIIPIYGAKGWEDRYIPYLSPQWMAMLKHVGNEARRLDLGVDMTMGTGWCFGGPTVSAQDANALAVAKTYDVAGGGRLTEKFDAKAVQALVAFSADDKKVDLTARIGADGQVDWTAPAGQWRVYAISQRPSGQRVKRASPGGEGHMLNLLYADAMPRYLQRFTDAFKTYDGPLPRALYHDSYEYRSDWAPDFFAQFEKRRGYRLQDELPALFGKEESDRAARVKCDYRETISDIMAEESLPAWVKWCHDRGIITRNEAHGSPGNLLDLYATADIPETEMFNQDRNKFVSMCAASAAHVLGKRLVAAETGTWLKEHFTETLADMKYLLDDLFLSGVNHIIYHGTCYSPDEAGWPGWLFYASYEMNPRNSIWRDVPALSAYVTRCQSLLQAGQPDNDLLLYWPIHDRWHNARGLVQPFTVHAREWMEDQPFGQAAERLWKRGYTFDYVSDRQLARAQVNAGRVAMPGGNYRTVVVPKCGHMPLPTLEKLRALAQAGATVIFESQLPQDAPGWGNLTNRRAQFKATLAAANLTPFGLRKLSEARFGAGRWLVGDLEDALATAGVARESLTDHPGLMFIRRSFDGGRHYFIANRGTQAVDGWIRLATPSKAVVALDPLTGRAGWAASRAAAEKATEVFVQLPPGASLMLRLLPAPAGPGPRWDYFRPTGQPLPLAGTWQVNFLEGGPSMPPATQTDRLVSWTEFGGEAAQAFAGAARYTLRFAAPAQTAQGWHLDLGKVCQSARVRLNGKDHGTLLLPPFRISVHELKAKDNVLEVEVTNVAANRIRDLDRRKVAWRTFHDINFVNQSYKPFDASNWPLTDSGLLGPVTLQPVASLTP